MRNVRFHDLYRIWFAKHAKCTHIGKSVNVKNQYSKKKTSFANMLMKG